MALTINEPIKTINGLLTKALAANSQLLYVITTDIDLNAVNNYRINVEIRDAADTFALFDKVFSYIPNQAGVLDLDVGETVARYMKDNGFFSFEYFLRVVEVWQGSAEPSTDTTILQAVLARKQLLSIGGANMYEFMLNVGLNPIRNIEDFTTSGVLIPWVLQEGVRWRVNENFDINNLTNSLNIDNDMPIGNITIRIQYQLQAVSGNTSGTLRVKGSVDGLQKVSANMPLATGNQNYFDMTYINNTVEPNIWGITPNPATADGLISVFVIYGIEVLTTVGQQLTKFKNPNYWLGWKRSMNGLRDIDYITRVGSNPRIHNYFADVNKVRGSRALLTGGFLNTGTIANVIVDELITPDGDAFYIETRFEKSNDGLQLSESIYFKIESECQNPIMLDWINSLGGIENWLFETSQAVQIVSDSGIVAERPINTDIEFITRTKQRFANTFRQQLTLRAHNLTFDQLLALQEIKQTESLRVYLSKDGANFIDGIVITTFTTDYNNKRNDHKFIVVIELPDGFIFEEGKLY